MSNTFKFIEVLDYGSGYIADRYTNNNGNLLVVSNGAVILESIADIVGNSNITIPSIEVGLLNSVPHYTGGTIPYILEDTAVYISNIGDMTGINELHTTDLYVSGDNVNIINSTLTGINMYESDVSETTNFNIFDGGAPFFKYNFNVSNNPLLSIFTESPPLTTDQYVIIQASDSNSQIPGPIIRASDASNYLILGSPVAIADITGSTCGKIILTGGGNTVGTTISLCLSETDNSDNTTYLLPTNIATTNNEVLTVSNTTAQMSWTPLTYPTSFIIPWDTFQYFVGAGGGYQYYWAPTVAYNDQANAFTGTPNRSYGSVSFYIPVSGTWRFSVSFSRGNNNGIATLLIDGTTTTFDTYSAGTDLGSYTWTQVISAGERACDLSAFTKNGSSSDYWLLPYWQGITCIKV